MMQNFLHESVIDLRVVQGAVQQRFGKPLDSEYRGFDFVGNIAYIFPPVTIRLLRSAM